MTEYRPIACADYDTFEIAIMRRQNLRLRWRGEGNEILEQVVRPLDLRVQNKGEYLIAESLDGKRLEIRLDAISSAVPGEPK